MLSELIGKPVVIEEQEVILLPDIIGMVPVTEQHEYVEIAKSTNTCAAIQMRESDIESVRKLYPKLPVYGLWQTLVKSQLVDVNVPLQVVPITDHDGYYVHSDVGRILYSGNYDAGFFAADTDFRLSSSVPIETGLTGLTLPKNCALLAREILSGRRRVYRDGFSKIGAIVGLMAFLAFAVDFMLQVVSEREYATIVEKDEQLSELKSGLRKLSKNRLVERPDQGEMIDRLAVILHDLEDVKIQGPITFKTSVVPMIVSSPSDPALLYPFVKSDIQPDGRWAILAKIQG